LNEDLNKYLDHCREARSELKQEKMKSDSMLGQWRFYRHQHKKVKREMRKICTDIDMLLNDSLDANDFKTFIIALKRRYNLIIIIIFFLFIYFFLKKLFIISIDF
jgi:hypothetical protein